MGLPIFDAATLDPQIGGMRAGFVPDSTTGGPGDKIHPNRVHIVARSPRKAKWGVRRGGRPEDIQGLAAEEHVGDSAISCCRWWNGLTVPNAISRKSKKSSISPIVAAAKIFH
jgi:hypothetical protein